MGTYDLQRDWKLIDVFEGILLSHGEQFGTRARISNGDLLKMQNKMTLQMSELHYGKNKKTIVPICSSEKFETFYLFLF